jgi:hypothetical protein
LSLIFKGEHLDKILSGLKTQTRRASRPKVKAGQSVRLRRGYSKYLPESIIIQKVFTQKLGDIMEEEIYKEGFNKRNEFIEAWTLLYGSWNSEKTIWVIDFVLGED